MTFDLTNLTFFNRKIWFYGDRIDDLRPLVEQHRKRTEQMLDFWNRGSPLGCSFKNTLNQALYWIVVPSQVPYVSGHLYA